MNLELRRIEAERNPVAVLHYAGRRPRGVTVVAAHGYSSSKQNLDPLCAFLAMQGFDVFSLDFPGHKLGASGGELRGFDDCLDALAAVVAFARRFSSAPLYALGHSLGAMTALLGTAADRTIDGVVSIATGYGRATALSNLMARPGTDFRATYVDGAPLQQVMVGVDARFDTGLPLLVGRPQLYVAATHDAMVSPQSARDLFDRAPEPKTFATVESDHTNAGERARRAVLEWLDRLHPRA